MTRRSGPTDRTLLLSVRSPDGGHMSLAFNRERLISMVDMLTGRSDRVDRTLNPQRLVVYSKGPKRVFADRTRPVMLDRTLPASGHTVTSYCADRQHDRTQPFSVRSLSDPASGQLTDASIIATNSISPLTSSPLFKCANHQVYHLVHMC